MTESTDIKINNETMWLRVSCGEVVSQQKWSETRVSSHGGYISAGGQYASAPSISSAVTEKHEFWIREADGKEIAIEFSDDSFQAREGHKVWVAWGGKKGQESGSYLFAHNFVTGKTTDIKDKWQTWLYKVGLIKAPLLYKIFIILIIVILMILWGRLVMNGGGAEGVMFSIPVCLFIWLGINFIGNNVFLRWRDKILVKSIKKIILDTCIESANKANLAS